MVQSQVIIRTVLALLAFAGNSLLCRLALKTTAIDAASFTTIRMISATLVLSAILFASRKPPLMKGDWPSATALFAYAAAFSLAYINLTAGTGALLLFGSVQMTMIGFGLLRGERFNLTQIGGLLLALAGLIGLVLPGLSAPPAISASLMIVAGIAWGIYSLRGRGATDPLAITTGNFLRTLTMTVLFSLTLIDSAHVDFRGATFAVASGAVTSGIGYAVWYSVLPSLKATQAATLQLAVPVIAALGAVLLLGETASLRLLLASLAILGGVALVIYQKQKSTPIKARP